MDVSGKTVCVTGVLAGVKRDEAEAGLEALGATVTGSVSKKTDILFVGAQPGSKLAKAEQLGITIADEGALLKVLGKVVSKAKLQVRAEHEQKRRKLEEQALAGQDASVTMLKDKTVVVTGTLSVERNEMEEMLRRAGARVTGSVSKKTDYLVVGAGAGSKLNKAASLGVKTLTEADVRKAIAGDSGSEKKPSLKKTATPAKKTASKKKVA